MSVKKKFKSESFESMMRRFKKSIEKRDVINEVKKREHFIKRSVKKKLAKEVAVKREKRRQEEQNIKRFVA
tara:strand:+ start:1752 stop:1964 length:213 start_codon:yes stop_codon:yes gene_type:complete